MNTMINLRERGQVTESQARSWEIGAKYKEVFAQVLCNLGVDEYYASQEQLAHAHSEADKACEPLQAEFDLQASQNITINVVDDIVNTLSGDLRGITVSLFNEFDQVKNLGYFSNGEWKTCDISELTDAHKERLLNAKTNQVKTWANEFLTTKSVVIETDSFVFVEVDDSTTLNADELKAARKAAKQAEKAAKIAAKKGRI